jgi:hypothetical protein
VNVVVLRTSGSRISAAHLDIRGAIASSKPTPTEAAMDMTAWERRTLQQMETDLTAESPRLARRLRAPSRWRRLVWGPRHVRMALVGVGLFLVSSAIVLASALTASPVPQR